MNTEQSAGAWMKIVGKASQDDAFKKRLLAQPAAVLTEYGIELPAGIQLRIVEDTEKVMHLTLPAKPLEGAISDDELEGVAGGGKAKGAIVKGIAAALAEFNNP